jgi:hypothetical protein
MHNLSMHYKFKLVAFGEAATLIRVIEIVGAIDPESFVVYFHSKGANYEIKSVYRN